MAYCRGSLQARSSAFLVDLRCGRYPADFSRRTVALRISRLRAGCHGTGDDIIRWPPRCSGFSAARLSGARASSADPLFLDQQNIDLTAFRRAIKRNRTELAAHQPTQPGCGRLRTPPDFDRMDPIARIKAIRTSGQAALMVDRLIQDRTQANLPKQVRGSLPAISSAIN